MENGSLIKQHPLDSDRIDYGAYTTTLIQEAVRVGLLDDAAMASIRDGLLALLRVQLAGATHGESTSAPTETADTLMDGIGYCVDLALKAAPSVAESIALLQTCTIEALHKRGAELLDKQVRACGALLSRVRATRTQTVNLGYKIALDDSLPGFLRAWGGNPYPHDFAVIIEYPLAVMPTQSGIPGVQECLAALALENRFCAHFSAQLAPLLDDYARQNRVSAVDAYVNLFTIALQNLLLCRLLGRTDMTLSAPEADMLQARLAALSPALRVQSILHAADALVADCAFENERLDAYVRAAAQRFAATITAHNLRTLAVIGHTDTPLLHTDGESLDEETFRDVTDEILLCDNVAGKIRVLRDEIHSLDDLCDLLNADCIFEEEFSAVFASFEPATAALLLTRVPVALEAEDCLSLQGDTEWQLRFVRYLNACDPQTRTAILQLYHLLV